MIFKSSCLATSTATKLGTEEIPIPLQLIMVAAILYKPEIAAYGLGVKVLNVKGVNMNITPTEEPEGTSPGFGAPAPAK